MTNTARFGSGLFEIDVGECGTMVPHRRLNRQWTSINPSLDLLIYPEVIKGHRATLTKTSSASSCLKLMGCYVNARNIPDHGFSKIAEISIFCDEGLPSIKYFLEKLSKTSLFIHPCSDQVPIDWPRWERQQNACRVWSGTGLSIRFV